LLLSSEANAHVTVTLGKRLFNLLGTAVLVCYVYSSGFHGNLLCYTILGPNTRVPTPPGKSWIFFLENFRIWKVLKITYALESPGKISLKVMHFSRGLNGELAAVV